MNDQYDIIVVGAGLVGQSVIASLAQSGWRIAWIEQAAGSPLADCTDMRPISLTHMSYRMLSSLSVWPALDKVACPIETVTISERGRFGRLVLRAQELRLAALGYVVPYGQLIQALIDKANQVAHVTRCLSRELISIASDSESAKVTYEDDQQVMRTLNAPLVLACDGAHSPCRALCDIAVTTTDHDEQASIFHFLMDEPHSCDAHQRITPAGTFAFLPMCDHMQRRLVWSGISQEQHEQMQAWSNDTCCDYMQQIFGRRIGRIVKVERQGIYPLQFSRVAEPYAHRCLLLGNAAHALYPTTAQGFNLALRDVGHLVDILGQVKRDALSLGSERFFSAYQDATALYQQEIYQLTQQAQLLYGLTVPGISAVRSAGLLACDLFTPGKRRLANQLVGIQGKSSRLASGFSLESIYHE